MAIRDLFEAFGITLGPKKDTLTPQIVKDVHDDGAFETIVSGGVYYDGYMDVMRSLSDEKELIMTYREISYIPEVDQAIIEVVNDAIVYPKAEPFPVKINLDNLDFSENIKKKIIEEFNKVLKLLCFDTKADDLFRKWYIDGRLPLYIHCEEARIKNGILKIIPIDPVQIKKIREIRKELQNGIEKIVSVDEKYIYFPDQNIPYEFKNKSVGSYVFQGANRDGIELSKDSVVYSTSGQMNEDRSLVLSFLHKAIKPANQLSQIEDSMIIYRISRAPERRIFYIDTGNLPKAKAEAYLNSLMSKFKNKLSYDGQTGKIKNQTHIRSILEDYWLPRKEGGKGTEISTLAGGAGFAGITDETNYFKHKLYKALNVPIGRLDSESSFVFGKSGEITREEIKFSKFINNIRNQFAKTIFDDILKVQLVTKKVLTEKEWELVNEEVFYQWEDDSHFSEMKVLEILEKKTEVLDKVNAYAGSYFSKAWIRKHLLFQTEEEIEELKKDRKTEEKEEPLEIPDSQGSPFDDQEEKPEPVEKDDPEEKEPEEGENDGQ